MRLFLLGVIGVATVSATTAWAHGGRRFEVKVVEGQLVAHGYHSLGQDDGGGVIRRYYNAIHGHWTNNVVGGGATATLPGFDVLDEAVELVGYGLDYELIGAQKWTVTLPTGGHGAMHGGGHGSGSPIHLMPLSGEVIGLSFGGQVLTTDVLGTVDLVEAWDGQVGSGNGYDLDFLYQIAAAPTDTIFVLEAVLSTDAPGVADSATVYTILSPQGHALHASSLELEAFLGTPVPEPAVAAVLAAAGLALWRRRAA